MRLESIDWNLWLWYNYILINYCVLLFTHMHACTHTDSTHITVPYLVFLNNHVYAWSVTFDARDQRNLGNMCVINHILTRLTSQHLSCSWSIIFSTRDQRKPGDARDQSHVDTPEQSCSLFARDQSFLLRVISVVSATRVISYFHLLLISHDAWSVRCPYAWSALTPDQRKLHQITPDQSTSSTPDHT